MSTTKDTHEPTRAGDEATTPHGDNPALAPGLASRPLAKYRTIDLVVAVAIGVVFGVVFVAWGQIYNLFEPVQLLFPPSVGLLTGVFFLPALVAALIVRRPGAALLAEVIAAALSVALGSGWSIGAIGSGLLQGAGVEIAFLLTAYKRFTPLVAIVGSVLSGLCEWVYERFVYYPEWSWGFAFAHLGFFVISSILLCGVLGWVIVRALARTGALGSFPAGRQWQRPLTA
jgi:energy-coupling factor transport system substrate-specific component